MNDWGKRDDVVPCLAGLASRHGHAELGPNEIRVWVVDLDAGLSPDDVETAEPGPEFELALPGRAGAGRPICAGARPPSIRMLPGRATDDPGRSPSQQPPGSLRFRAAVTGQTGAGSRQLRRKSRRQATRCSGSMFALVRAGPDRRLPRP